MPALKVLICGGGIAGSALAFWLSKLDVDITIVERHPTLRTDGLQIDIRGHGITVLRKMGLEDEFRQRSVQEQGLQFVNRRGKRWAYFPANRTGDGRQSFTSDFEIMRGDFCQLLYGACKDRARYIFGQTIDQIHQCEKGVDVRFSDGSNARFDLVIGADGQSSRTRRMMLGLDAPDAFVPLGLYVGFFTLPQPMQPNEDYLATVHLATKGRCIMTRRHNPCRTQAYLLCDYNQSLGNSHKVSTEDQKRELAKIFRDAGWRGKVILDALQTSDDFYGDLIGYVRLDRWYHNRVVLVGDAAYGPSSITGMGTTSALVGSYILAGEIGRRCLADHKSPVIDGLQPVLDSYQRTFQPFIAQVHEGLPKQSVICQWILGRRWAILILHCCLAITAFFRLDLLLNRISREEIRDWELPEYEIKV